MLGEAGEENVLKEKIKVTTIKKSILHSWLIMQQSQIFKMGFPFPK